MKTVLQPIAEDAPGVRTVGVGVTRSQLLRLAAEAAPALRAAVVDTTAALL